MKLSRRRLLHLTTGVAALAATSHLAAPQAWAQSYPTRPVRILVGVPAGGAPDIVARLIGQWLSERLGQPVVVENRPGAGTNIAAEAVVRAAPDGHTILLATSANAVNVTLFDKLSFNFTQDTEPVASIMLSPQVMAVNPAFPAKTLPAFVAYAKANPGKVTLASGGNGSPGHLAGEMLKMMAGINLVHVPYRGGAQAFADLIGGQVHVAVATTGASVEFFKAGKLRPLAVTTEKRLAILPDVPTVAELVPGYEASGWFGIVAPRGTPAGILDKLNNEVNAGLADPKLKARLDELGATTLVLSRANFGRFLAEETDKWSKVVKFAGIKAE